MTLKTRIIPILYIKNGLIVRSEGFSYHQNIGNVINEVERYYQWNVDELIYIDISREHGHDMRRDDHRVKSLSTVREIVSAVSEVFFMPLTFGGGIRSMDDIKELMGAGADKFVINTAAVEQPELLRQAADKYGSQAVVVSVDYHTIDGRPTVFTHNGQTNTGLAVLDWINTCERMGAGEILINCIERDGKGNGFDIDTANMVANATQLPTVACGGAGDPLDFVDLAKGAPALSGIAAGNFFHFTENAYQKVKRAMLKEGLNVRAA